MGLIYSFPPVSTPAAHTLILGSMPGGASLQAGQYYAHPRNLFWKIVGELIGAHPDLPYPERLRIFTAAGFALWDVLQSCQRDGSLDVSIDPQTITPNHFADFFAAHPHIDRVFFNGAMAETSFRRYVLRSLPKPLTPIHFQRLPSTSPANAGYPYATRLAAWRAIIERGPAAHQRSST